MKMAGRVVMASALASLLGIGCSSVSIPNGSGETAPSAAVNGVASSAPSSPTSCSWTVVRSPNAAPSPYFEQIRRVTVVSSDDVWALGFVYVNEEGGAERPLLLHWNGRTWRPGGDALGKIVSDISASSPSDVWAVGSGRNHGIAEHWNGSSWTASRLAEPATRSWRLNGVLTLSPSNAWTVGSMALGERNSDGFGALIEHWDGTTWSITPTPPLRPSVPDDIPYAGLNSVAASGPNDVWAVGEAGIGVPSIVSDTLVEHWDGAGWSVAQTPDVASPRGIPFDHLFSVAAVSPTDVWAVGSYGTAGFIGGRGDHPLVLHWDGIRWTGASTPPQQLSPLRWARLWGVAADRTGTVWAVGSAGSGRKARPIATTWDGQRWTASIVPGPAGSKFNDVAVSPSGAIAWAVGSVIRPGVPEQTLTERCTRQ
jgi:hypothetical protein